MKSEKKAMPSAEEITRLYTDTYRTRMPLYNDYVFRRIYGSDSEESRAALIGLLNIILERKDDPIASIELKNPIDPGEWLTGKETTMDIKAETNSREILDIEMQVDNLTFYPERVLFYGGRLVNSALQMGQPYGKMKKSIVVSIIKEKLFSEEIPCHSIFGVREKKTGYLLSDRLEFHFLELGKVNPNRKIEDMSAVERLAVYLRYASDENYKESVQKIAGSEEEIIMAENLYRRATKEEREAAWAESRLFYEIQEATNRDVALAEGHAAGLAEGRAEGRAEGEKIGAAQEKREIAKNFKISGIPLDVIAKNTGLTIHEIEEL